MHADQVCVHGVRVGGGGEGEHEEIQYVLIPPRVNCIQNTRLRAPPREDNDDDDDHENKTLKQMSRRR